MTSSEVTRLLAGARAGRDSDRLLALVYDDLRAQAAAAMAREPAGHTLEPTALVHEAWLRLVAPGERDALTFEDRAHFYRTAARAMRRILIDRARRVDQPKHGGGWDRVTLAHTPLADGAALGGELDALVLTEALDDLEDLDARMAELVTLRFFAGLGVEETARTLSLSERTVKREWSVAKAWLAQRLGDGPAR
ncbi:MAG: ECF-type sigma factor [Planctomycetota bacterium]